jgi:hypothetical protein
MEINLGQPTKGANGISSRGGKIPEGATVISPHLQRQSVFIDKDGNQIDPVTKRIIKAKSA